MFSRVELDKLTEEVELRLSPSRFRHTLGTVKAAILLGSYILPDSLPELEAAALLHDITKELSDREQLLILGNSVDREDSDTPSILHAYTAPYAIKRDFPCFATERVLSAVYKHTVGSVDMTLFDEIIFLADFIEEGRKYPSSIELRRWTLDNLTFESVEKNEVVLHKACIKSIDYTSEHLVSSKKRVNSKTLLTKTALLSKI